MMEFNVVKYLREELSELLAKRAELELEHAIITGRIKALNQMSSDIADAAEAAGGEVVDGKGDISEPSSSPSQ